MEPAGPLQCAKCAAVLKTKPAYHRHLNSCTGVHPLQCPACGQRFANHQGKSVHVRFDCKAGVLNFEDTDLEAVRLLVLENPAPFQVAHARGHLHQALLRATHWGRLPQNRNVLGIKANGTEIKILVANQPSWKHKASALNRMLNNNLSVFEDGRVRPLFRAPLKPAARGIAQEVVLCKGQQALQERLLSDVPPPRATGCARIEHTAPFHLALRWADEVGEGSSLVPFMVQIAGLRRSIAERGGLWFRAHGETGWTLVDCGASAVDWMVRDALHSATLVDDTTGLCMGMDEIGEAVARLSVGSLVEHVVKELTGQDARTCRAALAKARVQRSGVAALAFTQTSNSF